MLKAPNRAVRYLFTALFFYITSLQASDVFNEVPHLLQILPISIATTKQKTYKSWAQEQCIRYINLITSLKSEKDVASKISYSAFKKLNREIAETISDQKTIEQYQFRKIKLILKKVYRTPRLTAQAQEFIKTLFAGMPKTSMIRQTLKNLCVTHYKPILGLTTVAGLGWCLKQYWPIPQPLPTPAPQNNDQPHNRIENVSVDNSPAAVILPPINQPEVHRAAPQIPIPDLKRQKIIGCLLKNHQLLDKTFEDVKKFQDKSKDILGDLYVETFKELQELKNTLLKEWHITGENQQKLNELSLAELQTTLDSLYQLNSIVTFTLESFNLLLISIWVEKCKYDSKLFKEVLAKTQTDLNNRPEVACLICFESKKDHQVVKLVCCKGKALCFRCLHAFFARGNDFCPHCRREKMIKQYPTEEKNEALKSILQMNIAKNETDFVYDDPVEEWASSRVFQQLFLNRHSLFAQLIFINNLRWGSEDDDVQGEDA